MSKNNQLANSVAQASGNITPALFERQMGEWFGKNKKRMSTMAGSLENAQKMLIAMMETASKNPKLIECSPATLQLCLMNSAATGLFPGALQECAYVPFWNGKKKVREAAFIPQYQGLCKLAYNSGHVRSISSEVVYDADEFEWELGSKPYVQHRPFLGSRKDRGERVCAYCVIETRYGLTITVKSMDFINGIKDRSPGAKMSDSPWNGSEDDFDAMCRKTVLRQGLKTIPKSAELAQAIDLDNESERPDLAKETVLQFSSSVAEIAQTTNDNKAEESGGTKPEVVSKSTSTPQGSKSPTTS